MTRIAVDVDSTLNSVPGMWSPVIKALRAGGCEVWAVSANPDAAAIVDSLGIRLDHVVVVHGTTKDEKGAAKAAACRGNHIDLLIDNSNYAHEVTQVCSFARFHPGPH